jgi:hypothetical protein
VVLGVAKGRNGTNWKLRAYGSISEALRQTAMDECLGKSQI